MNSIHQGDGAGASDQDYLIEGARVRYCRLQSCRRKSSGFHEVHPRYLGSAGCIDCWEPAWSFQGPLREDHPELYRSLDDLGGKTR